jgi:hypothetical protein
MLANSGHMAPYLNGEAMAMEGALPLGMIEGDESSVTHFERKRVVFPTGIPVGWCLTIW